MTMPHGRGCPVTSVYALGATNSAEYHNFTVILPEWTKPTESIHLIFKCISPPPLHLLFPLAQRKLTVRGDFTDTPELQIRVKPAALRFTIITSWN